MYRALRKIGGLGTKPLTMSGLGSGLAGDLRYTSFSEKKANSFLSEILQEEISGPKTDTDLGVVAIVYNSTVKKERKNE